LQRDVSDVAALIEEFGGAAHVVGNSMGAIVSLRLLVARPELVASMAVHEPPLLGLLAGPAEWKPVLEVVNPRVGAVLELVASGRHAEAAERFVEEVALGPGQWALLPAERRYTLVRNAPTFLEETQDPSTYSLELAALKDVIVPVLISDGAQSPPFFGPIAQIVSKALGRATTYTFKEAGHVPHQTHPNEFVNVVGAFFSDAK
jgi:pimeloyl-ACP methyl ester carboxylesterase